MLVEREPVPHVGLKGGRQGREPVQRARGKIRKYVYNMLVEKGTSTACEQGRELKSREGSLYSV
jgi:hypothetical protein